MIKHAVVAALATVLVAGPAFADQHYRVVAANPKNGATIKVPVGDELQLKLTACESCGYRWKIVKKPDAAVIAFDRRQKSVSQCTSPCTGGNATERWLFDSQAVGSTTVKLGYFGPGKNKPSKTKRLDLAVTG
jgi:predicted secreted protein